MKSIITTTMIVLAAAVYLITWSGFSETWARGPAGKSKSTSRVTAPPVSAGVSSKKAVQGKKKSSGDKQEYMKYEMKDAFISGF